MRKKTIVLFCFVMLIAAGGTLLAQTSGKISGHISDAKTGEPLVGVNVTLAGTNMGAATRVDGSFFIINVPPGVYDASISMMGYETVVFKGLKVHVNRTSAVNVKMKQTVLETGEIVVKANRIAVKKDQTGSIRNISAEEMVALPIENVEEVISMQPGIVAGHFRGGRIDETAYLIDGISTANGLNRGRMVGVDPDAVQEVEVITGTFSAKYGEAMSGVVNMVTKEGGNSLHGKAEGYLGNYLTGHNDVFIGLAPEQVARNQDYKFMLDGPIIKDRLTFFTSMRIQDNKNHLNGIRRFNITDLPDYGEKTFLNPANWSSGQVRVGEYNGFIREDGEPYPVNMHTGDGEYVPMNWDKGVNFNGKLTWKLPSIKMSVMYLLNKGESQSYEHGSMYKPDGRNSWHYNNQMLTARLNHIISHNAFYELKFAYSNNYGGNYIYKDPLDPGYGLHEKYSANAQYTGFVTGGQDKGHYTNSTEKYLLRADVVWQATQHHSLETGFEGVKFLYDNQWRQILNKYRNTNASAVLYEPQVAGDNTVYSDIYKKEPIQAAAWLSDKMEFESMVIELGLRFDYFNPKTVYPSNYRNPNNLLQKEDTPEWGSTYPEADAKTNLSPRLGFSYQLAETALLRFSYGHFLQMPAHSTMYQNNSYVLSPTNFKSTLGNPQVNPEKTVNYELGLWQQLSANTDIEVALWYKDIYDLSTVNIVTTYNAIYYGLYGNKDYGNARGLELKFKAYTGNFFSEINYTLQYTRGNADNSKFTFNRAGNNQDPIPTLIPMSWDQRHTFNVSAGYNKENWGMSGIGYLGSGSAYSWAPIPQNPLNRINIFPNNSKKPFTYSLDVKMWYDIAAVMGSKVRLTLRVYNLFDRLNEESVNANTGRTNQAIIRPSERSRHYSDFATYEQRIYSPANWSTPRFVKLGLGLFF